MADLPPLDFVVTGSGGPAALSLTVATWNVNSLRKRLDHLARFVEARAPDVICLQETKVADDLFPEAECRALGYPHLAYRGMKSYNGVAILSRLPIAAVHRESFCAVDDCRHLAADIGGFRITSLYIPAGGDKPDPAANPKFAHKLRFLDEVTTWLAAQGPETPPQILTGDFNVAPLVTDVWSHEKLKRVVTHTDVERERLIHMKRAAGWVDVARRFVPEDELLFTWWSYRGGDWQSDNRGRRLDHIWVSPDLDDRLENFEVFAETRAWQPPSDHVPVLVTVKD